MHVLLIWGWSVSFHSGNCSGLDSSRQQDCLVEQNLHIVPYHSSENVVRSRAILQDKHGLECVTARDRGVGGFPTSRYFRAISVSSQSDEQAIESILTEHFQ